ncbi:MAG: hypothetical protein ABI791_10345 [Acidobacteriota bacterium]
MISTRFTFAVLLALTCSLFVVAGDRHGVGTSFRTSTSTDVRIDKLEIDRSVIVRPCRPGIRTPAGCNEDPTIKLTVTLSGKHADQAKVETVVSGGKIDAVGREQFSWDLAGVPAGTYTLTVSAADDKGNYTKLKTATVTVEECPRCVHGDFCPAVSINGPAAPIPPGETIIFTAILAGGAGGGTTYNWTVSAGTIVDGQGTPQIKVETDPLLAGSSFTATLSVSNPSWMMACTTTFSETAAIEEIPRPLARMGDEFRTRGSNCEEGFARMDAFLTELANDPGARGVVAIYGDTDAPRAARQRRQQLINFLKIRKFDRDRIEFVEGRPERDGKTQFWLIPAGAEPPAIVLDEGTAQPPAETVIPVIEEPYLYAEQHSDGIPGCGGNLYDLGEYAAALKADPASRGRIVIGESSRSKFASAGREILSELANYGIKRSRMSLVYKFVRPLRAAESTELWIMPPLGRK